MAYSGRHGLHWAGHGASLDAPGLTSAVLSRFARKNLPRPALPLDAGVTWAAVTWP